MICGLLFTKKASHSSYKWMLLLLIVTFCNELFCYLLKINTRYHTYIFYNLYWYFRFPLLGLIFSKAIGNTNKSLHFFIKGFYLLSVILFIVCYNLYDGLFKQLHTLYLIAGSVFVITNCMILFYQSVKNDEILNPFSFPIFISAIAFFIYFLGIMPFFGIINILVKKYLAFANNPSIVARSLSIFLYSLISIDYFLQWKRTK